MIVCFVICPNGFGHLYRSIDVINSLNKEKKIRKIYIICSKNHKNKINKFKEFNKKIVIKSSLPNLDLKTDPYDKLLKFYNFKLNSQILVLAVDTEKKLIDLAKRNNRVNFLYFRKLDEIIGIR